METNLENDDVLALENVDGVINVDLLRASRKETTGRGSSQPSQRRGSWASLRLPFASLRPRDSR